MPETARLPVLGLLGSALRDVFGNLAGLVRIAWPYYALAAICLASAAALPGTAVLLGPGTAAIVTGIAVLACTVKWQRHLVLAEPLRGTAPLNLRVARYLLWSILVGLLCALPLLAAAALAYAGGLLRPDPSGTAPYRIATAGILLCGAGGLAGALLFLRLCLVLPAISADDRSVSLARSWRLTRGNALRLLMALLLLTAGLALLGAVLGLMQAALMVAAEGGGLAPALIGMLLQDGINLIASLAGASLIARAYLTLGAGAGPGTIPQR